MQRYNKGNSLMKKLSLLFIAVLLAGGVFAANTNGELKFNGNLAESCNLQNFIDGTITADISETILSTSQLGGIAATVGIRANAKKYSLVLGTPVMDGPNGNETDVTFALDPIGTGTDLKGVPKASFGATSGVMNFDAGIYTITVNGTATKNLGAFEAGTYTLRVPVTCVKAP
jgi:hypothetical protein